MKLPRTWDGVRSLTEGLARTPHYILVLFGLALLLFVTLVDYLTGTEVSFSIFYLLPTSLMVWTLGRRTGLIFALLSSAAWLLADTLPGQTYSHPAIPVWNALVRFGFFLITVTVLASLRDALARERSAARKDALTGLANGPFFRRLLQDELARSRRYSHPMSLAYLDLDNFKNVNDRFGHAAGDALLRDVGALLRTSIRSADSAARLAGDEFALLMPESGEEVARIAVERIRVALNQLMQTQGWEVTSSIGLLTYVVPPDGEESALQAADALMYSAKRKGKNQIVTRVEGTRAGGSSREHDKRSA